MTRYEASSILDTTTAAAMPSVGLLLPQDIVVRVVARMTPLTRARAACVCRQMRDVVQAHHRDVSGRHMQRPLYVAQQCALRRMLSVERAARQEGALFNGVLLGGVGSGKTRTALALAAHGEGRTLWVTTPSLLGELRREIDASGWRHDVLFYHADFLGKRLTDVDAARVGRARLVAISYAALSHMPYPNGVLDVNSQRWLQRAACLFRAPYARVILDEVHRVRNPHDAVYHGLQTMCADVPCWWGMTASRTCSVMTFILGQHVRADVVARHRRRWDASTATAIDHIDGAIRDCWDAMSIRCPKRDTIWLRNVIELGDTAPPQQHEPRVHVVPVRMSPELLHAWHVTAVQMCTKPYGDDSGTRILNMRDAYVTFGSTPEALAYKLDVVCALLQDARRIAPHDKVIVALGNGLTGIKERDVAELVQRRMQSTAVLAYCGAQSAGTRARVLNRFADDPNARVMVCGVRVTQLGLNLQCANHLILVTVLANEVNLHQMLSREHRHGQDKAVHVWALTWTDMRYEYKTHRHSGVRGRKRKDDRVVFSDARLLPLLDVMPMATAAV